MENTDMYYWELEMIRLRMPMDFLGKIVSRFSTIISRRAPLLWVSISVMILRRFSDPYLNIERTFFLPKRGKRSGVIVLKVNLHSQSNTKDGNSIYWE